jgi:hypothetical protein
LRTGAPSPIRFQEPTQINQTGVDRLVGILWIVAQWPETTTQDLEGVEEQANGRVYVMCLFVNNSLVAQALADAWESGEPGD